MYKVFCNNRVIILTGPESESIPEKPFLNSTELTDIHLLKGLIIGFLEGVEDEILIKYQNEKALWVNFRQLFRIIQAAGGIVYKNGEALFIFRNGKWDLPKGKIEVGETPEEASVREVNEECGLPSVNIKRRLKSTYHIYKSEHRDSVGQWILKETIWYEMEYNGDRLPEPQTDEGITEVRWFRPDMLDIALMNTWESLVSVIRFIFHSS